jgi:hypothetical protein
MIARLTCRLARRCRNQRPPRPGSLPVIGIRCLVPGQNQLCRIAASAPQTRYVSERRFRRPGVSWQHHPCVEGAIIVISGLGMPPPGVRVLVATRPVDFRRGAPTQCKIRVFHSVDVFRLLLWLSHNREPPPDNSALLITPPRKIMLRLCSARGHHVRRSGSYRRLLGEAAPGFPI